MRVFDYPLMATIGTSPKSATVSPCLEAPGIRKADEVLMSKTLIVTVLALVGATIGLPARSQTDGALDATLQKMAAYVAGYASKASLIVAVEKYTQSVVFQGANPSKPKQLVAEFAIVKVPGGGGWVGYRDVVEVNGEKVTDRANRLASLLTDDMADASQVTKIANESARYNIGPISRNFNVPTAALFFFQPANLARFTFVGKDSKKIDGVATLEVDFKETRTPTFIMTRAGKDVPLEGTLWVVPEDGTVVRTRLRLRNFADQMAAPTQGAPAMRAPVNPNTPTGGREALSQSGSDSSITWNRLDSVADIEVTYRREDTLGLWLPSRMTELYEGPLNMTGRAASLARATTRAIYSDFKQFGADVKINAPK